ncbi:MAG: peptidylprolyl isomerase [Bacteroidaceae bacterium]|nr:peptidylprolyl isomerase [Bacteroidaceae bacterium]
MNRYILCMLCAVVLFSARNTVAAQDNVIDRVEWVVGDKSILRSDIEEAIKYWTLEGRKFDGDPYSVVGEDLAVQQLFLHQAAIDSVEIPETKLLRQVDSQIDVYIQRAGSKEKLEEYHKMPISKIREMLYENLNNYFTMSEMKNRIVGDIKVSPALVRRFCESLPEDSIPFVQQQVEVQIITMEPPVDMEEVDRVKEELRGYSDRIMSGETSFSTMALLYSEDPGSARLGGELDYRGRGQFVPEFATVAFNLTDPNKVSKIVETEYGFHIIQLVDKRGDRIKVRHILRKPRVSSANIKTMLASLDSIATDIRNDSVTFEEAVLACSFDKDTHNNYGIMYNKETGSSRFQLHELPVDVARVVDGLKVGEVSPSFTMLLDNGKTICAIVKLRAKIEAHKANIKDDYEILQDLYKNKLSEERTAEWIREKQKTTYVRLNGDAKTEDFKFKGWVFYDDKK